MGWSWDLKHLSSVLHLHRVPSEFSVFQSLKIQRSVGRARDGTTFPLSLKLKSKPSSEAAPELGYQASVWVFCTISGLITILPDGTIYGINHSFALMLFGYRKTELLGKVGLAGHPSSIYSEETGSCMSHALCLMGCST
jgi:hypothetical protein